LEQLKVIGCSCDWSRTRFTFDDAYSRAVREVFVRLWEEKLIYRGHRVIHWCPHCRTALSDEEAEFADQAGTLYYIRSPVEGGPAPQAREAPHHAGRRHHGGRAGEARRGKGPPVPPWARPVRGARKDCRDAQGARAAREGRAAHACGAPLLSLRHDRRAAAQRS